MSSDLTDAEVAELSADLDRLEGDLRSSLADTEEGAKPVDLDQPIGRLSRMDAMQQQKMVEANRRNAEARLRLVLSARVALGNDDYGLCRECEEPVGFRRLKARPETRYCLRCQSARESR
jgi:DnaK suppressor protein